MAVVTRYWPGIEFVVLAVRKQTPDPAYVWPQIAPAKYDGDVQYFVGNYADGGYLECYKTEPFDTEAEAWAWILEVDKRRGE